MKGVKERASRKKGGEEKKCNGCTLSFYNGYFGDSQLVLGEKKKLLDAKFRGNPIKYPAKGLVKKYRGVGRSIWKCGR